MPLLLKNLTLAFRLMMRHPASTLVMVLTLALGVGLNSAVFSLADAVLFRSLPFPEPEQLVAVYEARKGGRDNIPVADGNFFDLREQARQGSFSGLAAYACDRYLVTVGSASHRVPLCGVTADYFPVLGVAPALGQAVPPQEEGAAPQVVAVISDRFWQTAFGRDPEVLGRTVVVLGYAIPVAAVMPPDFAFPRGTDLWVSYEPFIGTSRTAHNLQVLGRLAPGVARAAAQTEMSAFAGRLAAAYGNEIGDSFDVAVKDLHADLVGDNHRTVLMLLAVVGTVLLIACGNIAGILLARSIGRLGEIGIRQTLGARRWHLAAQLLVESLLLGFAGALAGLALAGAAMPLLRSLVPASFLHSGELELNLRVALFAAFLGILAGVLCGLLPALQATRKAPLASLRGGQLVALPGGAPRRLTSLFVVAQYTFSLAAMVVAGLLVESLVRLVSVDPGFETRGLVTAEVILPAQPPSRYAEPAARTSYYETVVEQVSGLAGVRRATLALSLPLVGQQLNGLALREGDPMPTADGIQFYPDYRVVGSHYFGTVGTSLVLGRDFSPRDTAASEPVAIVNQALARQMWGDENPLGRRLRLPGLDATPEDGERLLTVVGVVPDARHWALDQAPRPAVYVPWTQHLSRTGSLFVIAAVDGDPSSYVQPVRQRIQAQDAGVPVDSVRTMEELVRLSTAAQRFRSWTLSAFAALALLLAVLGVYGVMSYSLSRREREMAVRIATGATTWKIRSLSLREGLYLILAGQILGTALLWGAGRLFEGFLFGVKAFDPAVLATASASLALIVLATCYVATYRVSRVDPASILRQV